MPFGGQADPPRRGRVGLRVAARMPRLSWLIVIVLAAAGFAVVASRPAAPPKRQPTGEVAEAARAIDELLDPRPGRDPSPSLPADFTTVTGHRPTPMTAPDGTTRAVHIDGGCSTPFGDDNTRWDYSVGCKAHDLGYDLLRYADAKGQPLGADLRERLDDRLSADMHAQCDINPRGSADICRMVASLYSVGLVVNSWHQRWGPPRREPIGPWTVGLVVIALLVAVRTPAVAGIRIRRRHPTQRAPDRTPTEDAQASYVGVLRIVSLAGILLAESVLAFAQWGSADASRIWPLTWLLQLVPLFFLTGGHANLLAWRAVRAAGGGLGSYLARQLGWLIRPALVFVTAWLVIPLSLELLEAPDDAVTAFGRLVAQPLWLLGLYLLVVATTPAMHALHRRLPVLTPLVLLAGTATLGFIGGTLASHAGGIALALLFQQLAFHYADGTLWRVPKGVLLAGAAAAFCGLIALTTLGGYPKLLLAEPTEFAAFAPSLTGVLLLGLAQTALVALPRERGAMAIAASRPARLVDAVRAAPMTAYLLFLCAMLLVVGVISSANTQSLVTGGVDWLTRPRTLLAFVLLGVPMVVAFAGFERRADTLAGLSTRPPRHPIGTRADMLAAWLGVGYGMIGILGFAVTGITGATSTPTLLGFPLDPMANLIHLLLGWYLLHCVHIQTSSRPWPWLVTAIACVPPMITTVSGVGLAVHGGTIGAALAIAVLCRQPASPMRSPAAVPAAEMGTP